MKSQLDYGFKRWLHVLWDNLDARKRIWVASIWWFFVGMVGMWIAMLVAK